jgi:hypothetical protein
MIKLMDENRGIVEHDINNLVFYMNGGLDYNDAYLLTLDQRKNLGQMIQKHFDNMNPKKQQQM